MQQQLTIIPHQSPTYYNNNHRIIIQAKTITIIKNHGLTQTVNNRWITLWKYLQGSSNTIIKKYEALSDLIKEFKGKTHGSQSHNLPNNSLQIVVYYEVPEGMREELKKMFETYTRNEIEIHH